MRALLLLKRLVWMLHQLTYLHDLAVLVAVQRVQLIGLQVVRRDSRVEGGSPVFVLLLVEGFAVSGLSAPQGVGQRGLQPAAGRELFILTHV